MIRAIKGTRDILPPSSAVWNHVEAVARRVFRSYNYEEIRTPVFEETQLFARGVGADTDIVTKEMYTFETKGGERITLRPEGTAGVARAFISGGLAQQMAGIFLQPVLVPTLLRHHASFDVARIPPVKVVDASLVFRAMP